MREKTARRTRQPLRQRHRRADRKERKISGISNLRAPRPASAAGPEGCHLATARLIAFPARHTRVARCERGEVVSVQFATNYRGRTAATAAKLDFWALTPVVTTTCDTTFRPSLGRTAEAA